ncbi:hypothetical protein OK016_11815 [Vibrio chagasii]|nr:hypothetical protein [Vibrio chagasii]
MDDSYNAATATKSQLNSLSSFKGQRWLILGIMAELGA